MPTASFVMILAVAGAISSSSASSANLIWVGFQPSSSSYKSVMTGCLESVLNARGVMKRKASAVMMTWTSQPCFVSWLVRSAALYAAIEPVTPNTMFLLIARGSRFGRLDGTGSHLLRLYDRQHFSQIFLN